MKWIIKPEWSNERTEKNYERVTNKNAVLVLYDAYRIRLFETWPAMSLNTKHRRKKDSVRQIMNRVNTYWNRWSTKWNEHAEYKKNFQLPNENVRNEFPFCRKNHFDQYGNRIRRWIEWEWYCDEMKWNGYNKNENRRENNNDLNGKAICRSNLDFSPEK